MGALSGKLIPLISALFKSSSKENVGSLEDSHNMLCSYYSLHCSELSELSELTIY